MSTNVGATVKVVAFESPVFVALFWHWFIAALPNILLVLAFVYAIMNISYLLWKWRQEAKLFKKRHEEEE